MGNPRELYKITVSSPEYLTLGDLLFDHNSVASAYFNEPDAFLAITKDGITNRQRIEATYQTPEEKQYIGAKATDLPLKIGTLLYIGYEKVNETSFLTEGIEVVSTNEPAFKAAQLAKIEADKGYFQVNKPIEGKVSQGTFKDIYPEVTVWIWCRALSPKSEEDDELTGQLIDLTPFIQKCTTNMGKNGGNWQIILPPLVCELDENRVWKIKKGTINRYINSNGTSIQGEGYIAQSSIFENTDLERSQFYFHNLIKPNDLILIRYETLDMEKNKRFSESQNFYVDKDQIADQNYDMIGLVDTNGLSVVPATNDVTVSISGRDLSKLFIEDGTYFYALENSQGLLKLAGESESKSGLANRVFSDGALQFLFLYTFTGIDIILKFIIQHLSNISVIPDKLFDSYGDRVNKRFNVIDPIRDSKDVNNQKKPDYKPQYKEEDARGIWKIVKLIIDDSVSQRRIQDSSFSTAQGSLLNFIRTAAQEPLVEFYMDTYGDMYHLIVRKPPYDQKALVSLIEGKVNSENGEVESPPAIVNIKAEDVLDEKLVMNDEKCYSWYHFVPKNCFFGDANTYSLSYLPAVFFEEYAQLYGSKPFQQTHPYMPFVSYNNGSKEYSMYEQQAYEDLKYVVETSQYLPFTRTGTITVNGDRRIKIGNIIRYEPTGEIFFVDSVQQNYLITENTLERTTVIKVSRGMVEQLIYGVFYTNEAGAKRYVSYYNIINTDLIYEFKDVVEKVTKVRRVRSKGGVVSPQPVSNNELPAIIANPFSGLSPVVLSKENKGIHLLEKYNQNQANKALFVRFINEINKLGYLVTITSTQRSYAEQAALKRSNENNAEPGHSRHESGAAIDINIKNSKTGQTHTKNSSQTGWEATGVPGLAKKMGLQWGDKRNVGSFGKYVDRVHFQIAEVGSATSQVDLSTLEEYTEEVKSKAIDIDKVFSKFKVNKFTFNFFLKNLQFDPSNRVVTSRNIYQNDEQGTPIPIVVKSKLKSRNGKK